MNIRSHIKEANPQELEDLKRMIEEEMQSRNSAPSTGSGKKIITFSDGASRGNPGHSALGVLLFDEKGKELKTDYKYLGTGTNNEAEYQALMHALDLAAERGAEQVDCFMDSELLVRQMNGQYAIKSEKLLVYYKELQKKIKTFKSVRFTHVPREHPNLRRADALANKALDEEIKRSPYGG